MSSGMWKRAAACAAVVAVALASTLTAAAEGVLLRVNLQTGQKHRLVNETRQTIDQEVQGTKVSQLQESGQGFTYEVLEVDTAGNYRLRVTYDWMKIKVSSGGVTSMDYDSKRPGSAASDPVSGAMAAFVGQSFEMTMNNRGKVVAIKGMGAIIDRLVAASGGGPTGDAIRQQLQGQFGDEAMSSTMQGLVPEFPEQAVEIGQGWSNSNSFSAGGMSLRMDNRFKLESREGGKAKLALDQTISTPSDAKPMETSGIKVYLQMQGQTSGWVEIDEKTGMPTASKQDMDMKGAARMEGPGLPQPMNIPMTIKGTATVSSPTE